LRIIRASEIGTFCFCQRAWWYQTHGMAAENLFELNQGTERHIRHNNSVFFLESLKLAGYILLIIGIAILLINSAQWLF